MRLTHAKALQIDFDAPESARPFYRDLLVNLRSQLPEDTFISITALVLLVHGLEELAEFPSGG